MVYAELSIKQHMQADDWMQLAKKWHRASINTIANTSESYREFSQKMSWYRLFLWVEAEGKRV